MPDQKLLKPADIAKIFSQSLSWVSKNYKKLGGVKIGGRMFFPPKEKLYERLFGAKERLEVRLHDEGREVHPRLLQDEARSERGRAKKKVRAEHANLNRHGLLDVSE